MNRTIASNTKITKLNKKEFAELILASPNRVHIFTGLFLYEDPDACKWYCITNVKLFDVQSIFINRCAIIGGSSFTFDIPDYDEDVDASIGEEQSMECLESMMDGLAEFCNKYHLNQESWYVKTDDYDVLEINYQRKPL